jgi:ATP-dependent helicase/nuclease subunit B
MKFLDQLAIKILDKGLSAKSLNVILPSERAKRYLINALFKANEGPLISPNIFTIDQWVEALSNKTILHQTSILLSLYEVYETTLQENALSFEDYLTWGPILLSDFDDVDRYLVDHQQLYQNLASIKALESWQIDEEGYSASQQKFMQFWELIPQLHAGLQAKNKAQNACSKAQAYRQLAENPAQYFAKDQYYVFAGFNALSAAEQRIIKYLIDQKQGEFIIDSDAYYLENKYHEAGHFQRKNLQFFGLKNPQELTKRLQTEAYDVKVIECAQHIGQVKVLATELIENPVPDWSEVLVLLADEALVHAAIRNIPKIVGQANITLGLPLDQTPIRTWIDLCFQLQENQLKFKTKALYHKDFQRFCHHAFVSLAFDQLQLKQLAAAEKQTIKYNRVFQRVDQLKLDQQVLDILTLLSTNWGTDWKLALLQLRKLNSLLLQLIAEGNDFEKTAILSFEQACRQFDQLTDAALPKMNLSSFKKLFYQHWTRANLAYLGSPTTGLQITGLLETRLLDFERVYVLGMNEGKLPPTNPIQSIIPMDLRSAFGMPNNRDKQGLFAQHFYRLLHHARSFVFTYTSTSEVLGSHERSRYLLQLQMEWLQQNKNVTWKEYFYQIPSTTRHQEHTLIPKTSDIQARIKTYLAGNVSASALRKYVTCPLDFYYRYVVEFGEEDEVEEDIATSTFGSLIHSCLEELYTPYAHRDKEGKIVTPAPGPINERHIAKMLTDFPEVLRKYFMKYFDNNEALFQRGKNLLSFEMALDLTQQMLLKELAYVKGLKEPLVIEQLEAKFELNYSVQLPQETIPIHFVGYIDRIDRIGANHYRVIDYKSGKVKDIDVKMSQKDDAYTNITKPKHALQLCLYSLFFKEYYGHLPAEARIESLINRDDEFALSLDKNTNLTPVPVLFDAGLQTLLENMLNETLPFEHDQAATYCQFCT